jgi:hypothetical protein
MSITIICEKMTYANCYKCNRTFFVLYWVDLGIAKMALCRECLSDLVDEIVKAGFEADIHFLDD